MRTLLTLLSILVLSVPSFGQLPEFYKSVETLVWVVDDLERAVEGWKKLGFTNISYLGDAELEVEYRGKPAYASMRVATGRIGGVVVDWVQPLGGGNAYSEFLKKHGSGVFSLMHRASSSEAYDKELERLKALGVAVLQSGVLPFAGIRYAYLDTEPEGKYVLGLVDIPGSLEGTPLEVSPEDPSGLKLVQYAFAVKDLDAVSKYWAKLGFPAMDVTSVDPRDYHYRGKPADFNMKLGWQRHGQVVYEWILSTKGPNVYLDHMDKHGEGVHHIAFNVDDMDKAIARWNELGFLSSQSGAWGEKDKPGSGRFSYQDTQSIGGIDVELLWNYKAK